MKLNWDNLENGLKELKALTNSVVFPYSKTVEKNKHDFKFVSGSGVINTVYTEPDCSIAVASVTKGSVHQMHTHKERELLCVLDGKMQVNFQDRMYDLGKYGIINIDPEKPHTNVFLEDTKVLAILLPASEDFPNV